MSLGTCTIDRKLQVSGILLILGLLVEIVSLVWERPLAFLLFAGVAVTLTFAGIILYLYSLLPSKPAPKEEA